MSRDNANTCASPPCLLDQSELACDLSYSSPAITPLLNALSRAAGIRTLGISEDQDDPFPASLSRIFTSQDVASGVVLAAPGQPWHHVYFIQYGILQLSRLAPGEKVTIHEFFSEGVIVWPVFEENRTAENTLGLVAATGGQVWAAEFEAFHAALKDHGIWERFALSLTRELADRSLVREFRRQQLTAAERYRHMLEEYPLIASRVSEHKLADWLGMDHSTFSRIKAEVVGHH